MPLLLARCLPGAEPDLKTEVPRLVRQLDDDSSAVRLKAKNRLIELGPAVLDLLPSPDAQSSPSVTDDLRDIIKQIQKTQAAQNTDAATVTLQGKQKVSQVLAEIERQTGNTLIDLPRPTGDPAADAEITAAFQKTPFWTALDSALDQARLSIYPYGNPHSLKIVPRGPNELPRSGRADVVGPLRIEPVSVVAKRELRVSTPPSLQVVLEVAWEPRLQPISIKQRAGDVKAIDSRGGSLAADDLEAEKEVLPRLGSSAAEMEVSFMMPEQPIREIASLRGSLRAILLGKTETFRFANLLEARQQQRIAAATVTLDEVRKSGDSWEVHVKLRYDNAGDALESHRNWPLQNEAYLEDAQGKRIQPVTLETTLRTKNEIGFGCTFALRDFPKNCSFVYKAPGMIVTKDFPYELRGIKTP